MKHLYLLFVLLCLSGISMAQPVPQFATASFTYERATCNSYQISFHGNAAAIDTSDAIADYSWSLGYGDSTYHGKNVTTQYPGPGTYMVWLNVRTVKGDTASTFRYVTVYQDSTSLFATLEVHRGSTDSLVAYPQSAEFGYYAYQWYWNDTLVVVTSSGIVPNPLRGTYKVAVVNSLGCTSVSAPLRYRHMWDSTNIFIGWAPVACDRQSIQFAAYVDADLTQVWNFGDNHGWVGANPQHYYDSAGVYMITLTLYDGAEYMGSITRQIDILGQQLWGVNIDVDTLANGTKTLTAYTIPQYAKVVWNTGDSLRTISVTKSGLYIVTVLDQCGQRRGRDSIYVTVVDTLYSDHNGLSANITKAFPNPSTGLVNVQFARPLLKKVVVSVLNQQGQVLYTRTTAQQSQQLDLSALPKGYYMIVISDGVTRKVQPLLLQ
jgi:PKD repeat protein